MNVELAELEGKKCWGLHYLSDYYKLLNDLGFDEVENQLLKMPDRPGYVYLMSKIINEKRPIYIKNWGERANEIIDRTLNDFASIPARALSLALIWGIK